MPLRRTGPRWRHNIKLIFKELKGRMDWIDLAQDIEKWWAVVNS